MKRLEFTFLGPPVPYTRMTQGTRWTKASQNYLGYRNALADALRRAFPDWVIPAAPAKTMPKAYRAWLSEQKKRAFALKVDVWFARDAGDWDNAYKGCSDALQCAGLIWNDKTIVHSLGGWRRVDKENPRVEILLEELP